MKKQFVLNLISQILFFCVNIAISFFLVPKIVIQLTAEAYGFISISNDFVGYIQIITVALNSMAARFIVINLHKKEKKEANKYFNSVVISNLIMSVIVAILATVLIVFVDKILNISPALVNDVKLLLIFVFLNFIITIMSSVFGVGTFATNKLHISSVINIVSQLIRATLLIFMYNYMTAHVWYFGFTMIICGIITAILNYFFMKKLTPELKFDFKQFDFKYVKDLLKSGIWNSLSRLSNTLSNGLDLLITNLLVGAAAMGVLAFPKTIYTIMLTLFGSLSGIFAPLLMMKYAEDNIEEIKKQVIFSIKFLGVFSNILVTCIIVFGYNFFKLWIPTQDASLLQLLSTISCIAFVFSLPLEPIYNIFTVTNKIKVPSIILIITSFITILIVFVGLLLFNDTTAKLIIIAGTSTVIGTLRVLLFLPIYGSKVLNTKKRFFYPAIIQNFVGAVTLIVLAFIYKEFFVIDSWFELLITGGIIFGLGVIVGYFMVFDSRDRKKAIELLANRFSRKGKPV